MLGNEFLSPSQFFRRKTEVSHQAYWFQHEFGGKIVPIYMDMRRLIGFVAVEVKAVRATSQNSWHELSIRRRDRLARPKAVETSMHQHEVAAV